MSDVNNDNTSKKVSFDTISLDGISSGFGGISEKVALKREASRVWIALFIVGSMFFIVIGAFVILCIKEVRADVVTIDNLREVIEALISPVVGVVGAVTGFYFGERSAHAKTESS